jgi:hypothetical protein
MKCAMDWLWSLSCLSDKADAYPNPGNGFGDKLANSGTRRGDLWERSARDIVLLRQHLHSWPSVS